MRGKFLRAMDARSFSSGKKKGDAEVEIASAGFPIDIRSTPRAGLENVRHSADGGSAFLS